MENNRSNSKWAFLYMFIFEVMNCSVYFNLKLITEERRQHRVLTTVLFLLSFLFHCRLYILININLSCNQSIQIHAYEQVFIALSQLQTLDLKVRKSGHSNLIQIRSFVIYIYTPSFRSKSVCINEHKREKKWFTVSDKSLSKRISRTLRDADLIQVFHIF